MARWRVLVVDDSVVVRRLVTVALTPDPEIEVVGTAADGRIALAKIDQLRPDVVTLDIEMPVMDGLAALREIRTRWPELPVIMFSTLTQRGATATLDALALGASDYVAKPSHAGDPHRALEAIRDELAPKIKALAARRRSRTETPALARIPGLPSGVRPSPQTRVDVVAIGVSTGGPNALAQLFPRLPASLPVPIVVVQHMPPMFTRILAERLDATSAIRVVEAADGDELAPGGAWIAPGGRHMLVERAGPSCTIRTTLDPPVHSCRPAVDPLFRSVVECYGAHVLAVVLTGMGNDGTEGAGAVRAAGGQVVVQDEGSSVVWGMPGSVAMAGLADAVVPLSELHGEILARLAVGRPAVRVGEGGS
jgi:two-component system chemotaxis response regulator CheB